MYHVQVPGRAHHDVFGALAEPLGLGQVLRLGDGGAWPAQELADEVQRQGHKADASKYHEQQPPRSGHQGNHVDKEGDADGPDFSGKLAVDGIALQRGAGDV